MRRLVPAVCTLSVALALSGVAHAADAPSRVQQLQDEARALGPLVHTALARDFLDAVPRLPHVEPRTVYRDSARTHAWTAREAAALPDSVRARLVPRTLDEAFYYDTLSEAALRWSSDHSTAPILQQLLFDLSEVLHPSLRARQGRLSPPAHGEVFDGKWGANRLPGLACGHTNVRAHHFPDCEPG
jgi:hypothetical protein